MMGDKVVGWSHVVEECSKGVEECNKAVKDYLKSMCPDESMCMDSLGRRKSKAIVYRWVETVMKSGVPDGRARLILYVISRYLVNVKGLDVSEAELAIEEFIDNSCKNYGDCSKIYKSWIRNVLKRVKDGGWMPWSLDRIKKEDPDLYNVISKIIDGSE